MARYLNRSYWEQKQTQEKETNQYREKEYREKEPEPVYPSAPATTAATVVSSPTHAAKATEVTITSKLVKSVCLGD